MMRSFQIRFILLSLLWLLAGLYTVPAQTFVEWNAEWHYFRGNSNPPQSQIPWTAVNYDPSGWEKGNAPFWYGDGSGGTLLSDMMGKYSTLFLRKEIQVTELASFDEVRFTVDYDDGFILLVNGLKALHVNAPQNTAYNQFAPGNHESGEAEIYTLSKTQLNLTSGKNVIAVQGFNVSLASSDFYFNLKAEGIKRLPETDTVTCNISSGFHNTPFSVIITGSVAGETIKYTLDGSDPRYSTTAISGTSPLNIGIDPASTAGGRGKTGGVVLRASAFKEGFEPPRPLTRTYIFPASVKNQVHPGGAWPTTNVNGQILDFAMDTKVTNDARYRDQIEKALLDIPTISVVTDPDNMFGSRNGIYVNAVYHGKEWERPANIELINPGGEPGFNIDAGIRIRGGWSRHSNYPKHAFRLFFRSEYGKGKLRYPLFEDEGVAEFDKVDLRTSQNYSWANGGSAARHNTMNRDVFSRETQRDMNQPYTRSRYYHLYINGLYWGIFQTQERGESNFAESYLGGDKEDYDVIKVDIGENFNLYEVEATDGNTDAWEEIWRMCQQGFASNENYFRLIGHTPAGVRDTSLNVWVDIDNLIDYMLVIFYAGNFDAPVSKFSNNVNPNNFYAIYNRNNKREGFKFLIHDAEHTLLTDPVSPGIGLNENRVNIGRVSPRMDVTYFGKFHPQWLHFRLSQNEEYKIRFADRVYLHFFNNGVFTPEASISRFKNTADQLDLAIIAESARWGDQGSWPARTRDDDWLPAVNRVVKDFMPYRTTIVLNQLKDEKLYGTLNPPVYKNNGNILTANLMTIEENFSLLMENPNPSGSIFYTTDGSDPRATGGGKSSAAIEAGGSRTLAVQPGTMLKARILSGNIWSAVHTIVFQDASIFHRLKVTELHYHPPSQGPVDGKDLEFIELKNTGPSPLNLSGLTFTSGIRFAFPEGFILGPGKFVVIASNMEAFKNFYGFPADFAYSGNLSNSGETITLMTDKNQLVLTFSFYDKSPWPEEADGKGYSLVSADLNPTGDPNDPVYWRLSVKKNGSPGQDDLTGDQVTERTFDALVYPNPSKSVVNIDFTADMDGFIDIGLYDMNGRLLHTLIRDFFTADSYHRVFHLENMNLRAGMYLIVCKSEKAAVTRKLVFYK